MLIRFVVDNIFSFGEEKEFTTIPNTRLKTLRSHLYKTQGIEISKLFSIYGANGAGKSNLVKALYEFQQLIKDEDRTAYDITQNAFKFTNSDKQKSTLLAIEFISEGVPFYYGVEIQKNIVKTEELYISGLGKKDSLLFERKTNDNKETNIVFFDDFERSEKNELLKEVLLEEFVKPDQLILKLLSNRANEELAKIKSAYNWFDKYLQIIFPQMKAAALVVKLENNESFRKYAEELMKSFDIGITSFTADKAEFKKSMVDSKAEYEEIIKEFEKEPDRIVSVISTHTGQESILLKENDTIWIKQLKCCHHDICDLPVKFTLEEESDGTIRLLDFIPAFYDLINKEKVFVIDEIERSIHPLLIKELIKKFSLDNTTRGQLIFTTHESNLLDQEIFRQDEIWFTEKDSRGITDLYSLNDFKEHKTIDIQKGYLSGKYGSIPFLGNLSELNWH